MKNIMENPKTSLAHYRKKIPIHKLHSLLTWIRANKNVYFTLVNVLANSAMVSLNETYLKTFNQAKKTVIEAIVVNCVSQKARNPKSANTALSVVRDFIVSFTRK